MNMKDTLTADLKLAMKMKSDGKVRLETIRAIMAAVTNFEKANVGVELDLAKILRGLANQRKMAIAAFDAAGETERSKSEADELSIIQEYIDKFLPKQMDDAYIRASLETIIVNLGGIQGKPGAFIGRIMGEFMKLHKNQADPKQVGVILKELLPA